MLAIFAKTSIELAVVLLLIYGFIHEKEVIKQREEWSAIRADA